MLDNLFTSGALNILINQHTAQTQWEPKNGRQDSGHSEAGTWSMTVLEANHFGMVGWQERIDSVLSQWIDIVIDRDPSCLCSWY